MTRQDLAAAVTATAVLAIASQLFRWTLPQAAVVGAWFVFVWWLIPGTYRVVRDSILEAEYLELEGRPDSAVRLGIDPADPELGYLNRERQQ